MPISKHYLVSSVCILLIVLMTGSTYAQTENEEDLTLTISLDAPLNSKYVWRGLNLVDDFVFQPSATVGLGNLSFSMWGSMELTNTNLYPGMGDTAGEFTEVDYTVDYSWSMDIISLSAGLIHYAFPNTGFDSTTEIYGSLGFDAVLSPSVTWYQDIDAVEGSYISFAVGHTMESLMDDSSSMSGVLELGAEISYGTGNFNAFYYGSDEAGLTNILISAAFPISLDDNWSITPMANFSSLVSGDIRDVFEDTDIFWFGISISFSQ